MGSLSLAFPVEPFTKHAQGSHHEDVSLQGMGEPAAGSKKQLLTVLEREPESVTWSQAREITLSRDNQGKLGLKFHTIDGQKETFTVVTKVKVECQIQSGRLHVLDRIININHNNVVHLTFDEISYILKTSRGPFVLLKVRSPKTFGTRQYREYPYVDPLFSSPSNIWHGQSGSISNTSTSSSTDSDLFKSQEINLRKVNVKQDKHKTVGKTLPPKDTKSADLPNDIVGNSPDNRVIIPPKDYSNVHHEVDVIVHEKRNSNESRTSGSEILTHPQIKRGHSQVSGNSNQSAGSSTHSSPPMRRRERMGKKGDKKKFYPEGSENPESSELEPLKPAELKPTESLYPPMSKVYSNFTAEDRAYSMPVSLAETAVSVQDIEINEQSHSLPIVMSPEKQHVSSCQCAVCTCIGEGNQVCCSCGTKPTGVKSTSLSGLSLFTDLSHGHLSDELLANPHMARWDGKNTHVVEIDKGPAKEFGFSYKVKIGKNPDASVEIYTLVKSIDKGGPAQGKLRVGDWIRSVNGTPIQLPTDAFTYINNSTKMNELRLVIQRPIGLSVPSPTLRSDKSDKSNDPVSPLTQSLSPTTTRDLDPLLPSTHLPGIIEPQKVPERKVPTQNRFLPDKCNDITDISKPPLPITVKLPKVRMFICGSEAEKCAQFILSDSGIISEVNYSGYCHILCSMGTDCFGNVVISSPCSNLYSTGRVCGDAKCKHCGGDFIGPGAPSAVGTVVNVELFVIPDDKLFNHCCSYLFTKSSIFILTFDGAKLLRSAPSEFSRLQNLSHTIRSNAGDDCQVMSCGMLDCDADTQNLVDEVQALFYTPFNTPLQNFSVCGPELVKIQSSVQQGPEGVVNEKKHLQAVIWKSITETIQRQRVLHPLLLILDNLSSARETDMFLVEAQFMEIIKQKLPMYGLDVHHMVCTDLIMNGEIILGKATPLNIPHVHKIESHVMLNPHTLLDHMCHMMSIIAADKQSYGRTHSTSFISALAFTNICKQHGIQAQYLIEFMECFGLIFRRPNTSGPNLEYFLPYFSLVPSSADCPHTDKKDFEFYLQFSDHESVQTFFHVVFMLDLQSDSPGGLVVQNESCCVIQHRGMLVTIFHMKIDDRVKFIFRREEKLLTKAEELFTWLYAVCHKALNQLDVHFLLGSPCPLGEGCVSAGSQGIHIIDLREHKPQYCGEDRVDTHKHVRMWRTKDAEMDEPIICESPKVQDPGKRPLLEGLGYTVFDKICRKLWVPSVLGRDWKGLAGHMGYNVEEVEIFGLADNPPRHLLHAWSCSCNGTIDDLIKLLEDLERVDIVGDIRQSLQQTTSSSQQTVNTSPQTAIQHMDTSSQGIVGQHSDTSCEGIVGQNGDKERGDCDKIGGKHETKTVDVKMAGDYNRENIEKQDSIEDNTQVESLIEQYSETMTPVETFHMANHISNT